jgi:hypothetical protein
MYRLPCASRDPRIPRVGGCESDDPTIRSGTSRAMRASRLRQRRAREEFGKFPTRRKLTTPTRSSVTRSSAQLQARLRESRSTHRGRLVARPRAPAATRPRPGGRQEVERRSAASRAPARRSGAKLPARPEPERFRSPATSRPRSHSWGCPHRATVSGRAPPRSAASCGSNPETRNAAAVPCTRRRGPGEGVTTEACK